MDDDPQEPEPTRRSYWLATAADVRGNLVRMVSILGFYSIHLLNVYLPAMGDSSVRGAAGLDGPQVSETVHLSVSLLAFAWLMQALGVHLASLTKPLTRNFAMAVAIGDVVWLTAALCFSTGAAGPLVAGYFLIIGLAALRLDLWLIRWVTVASTVGYLFVIGATRWPVGFLKEINIEPVPRYHQVMTMVALVLMGVVLGQVVRLGWGVVATYRIADAEIAEADDE